MWDLSCSGAGLEPVSPALAGGFNHWAPREAQFPHFKMRISPSLRCAEDSKYNQNNWHVACCEMIASIIRHLPYISTPNLLQLLSTHLVSLLGTQKALIRYLLKEWRILHTFSLYLSYNASYYIFLTFYKGIIFPTNK